MYEQIKAIIEEVIRLQDSLLEKSIDISKGESSPLFGANGQIDSLTLVSIIVGIEERIKKELGIEVQLADTSDLPETETPFVSLGAISNYVMNRVSVIET